MPDMSPTAAPPSLPDTSLRFPGCWVFFFPTSISHPLPLPSIFFFFFFFFDPEEMGFTQLLSELYNHIQMT